MDLNHNKIDKGHVFYNYMGTDYMEDNVNRIWTQDHDIEGKLNQAVPMTEVEEWEIQEKKQKKGKK